MWQSVSLLSLTLALGTPAEASDAPAIGDEAAVTLQTDATSSPEPEAPPAEPPVDPPAEGPATDGAPAPEATTPEAATPEASVGTLPDADASTPTATEPPPEEPRTWNDPEAAMAQEKAEPGPPPPPVNDLGSEPLEPNSKKRDPRGFGMTMVGALTFSPQSGHAWAEGGCPVANIETAQGTVTYAPGCSASPSGGLSAEGRFGYMWPFVGVELYGQFAIDYVNARLDGLPPLTGVPEYATQMHIGRVGIGGGAMARFKTVPGPVRLSVGAGGGFLVRGLFSNVSSLDGSFEDYVAPVLRADVGVVLAQVFTIGIMGWLEFPPTVAITPDLSILGPAGRPLENALSETVVVRGTQGVVGLFGGFSFGK